jgi:hypothetical protein
MGPWRWARESAECAGHHHFGSKDGLWRAAVDAVFSNVPRIVTTTDDASSRETLAAIIERFRPLHRGVPRGPAQRS